ncbi:MAG TPA: GyrI-like domain-containing protein [Thermoleophilia bacterium]|nr:GyrI-like domain-containing protein [Thermoleophilia bacterium]
MGDGIEVKQVPAQLALVVHTQVSLQTIKEGMGAAFDTLMRHARATGTQFVGPPFVLYPEMPSGEFQIAVCMPAAPGAVAGDDVVLEELPAVEAATLLYQGPYDGMEPSWRRLMEWVGASGRRPAGPLREIYLSDPDEVEAQHLLTELVVPLA